MTAENIFQHHGSDPLFTGLLDEVREYAQAYLLSKERMKGCDGMSLHVALTEEFKDAVDKLSSYCRKKNYPGLCFENYDVDSIADFFHEDLRGNART